MAAGFSGIPPGQRRSDPSGIDRPADPTGTSPEHHGNLAVVPLIANQRYYGEIPMMLP
jgi:hypothetical protein